MLTKICQRTRPAVSRAFSTPVWINKSEDLSYTTQPVSLDSRPRHFLHSTGAQWSPWHDIALQPEGSDADVFNAVIEITRGTTEKMEIETTMQYNPIVQDQKKDKTTGELKLRHYALPPPFNYGAIPRTWENAQLEDKATGCIGDNDPLDVVDLTNRDMALYEMPKLKILGSLCLIDQEELDWKLLAIEESQARALGIKNVEDFNRLNPGAIKEIMEWFRVIKTYDGKPANRFGYDDKVLGSDFTLEVISENHQSYNDLISGKIPNPDGLDLTVSRK